MPTVTGLRETRGGRIAVELDGGRWRTFDARVIVAVRLVVGEVLERPRARALARERRRIRALDAAVRAVERREQSSAQLRGRLARRRIRADETEAAVAALERVGLVDDGRYAARRAESLATRGYGDAAIRWRLGQEGIAGEAVDAAVSALEPERERARRLAEARGRSVRTSRELARRGFGEEAIAEVLGDVVADGARPPVD